MRTCACLRLQVPLPSPQFAGDAEPYPLALAADAVVKLNHYASCGSASKGIAPQLSGYYGPVDAQVQAAHAAGKLNLKSIVSDAEADSDGVCACQSSLHCARSDSTANGSVCKVYGVCGAVCMHGFPVLGTFSDMRTPEQFAYYLLLLQHVVQQRSDLCDAYVDFGCRLRSTWSRFVSNHPDLPARAASLRIMVNWLHANGHDLACQLQNSGRYQPGAGCRVGEQIEQLWSQVAKVS